MPQITSLELPVKPIRLYLQDQKLNKNRYYTIQIQPDLYGRFSLIREWGRIDNNGGLVDITPSLTEHQALLKAEKIEKHRLSRGYTTTLK